MACRILIVISFAVAVLLAPSANGDTARPEQSSVLRALVVGIDEYKGAGAEAARGALTDLAGAVNDSRDIAGTLDRLGVDDLTVLENGAATRERLVREWAELLDRSLPGDTVFFTFAGHGGQEPERFPGSEKDHLDEVLLLGGFRTEGLGSRERIFDDELNQWFDEAGERGLRVIFVADSCHSGTLTRGVDPRAPDVKVRTGQYAITGDMLELDISKASTGADDLPAEHVIFLAAGQEHEKVPELVLPDSSGQARGALSYMFARALEGEADTDRDGHLRLSELQSFIRNNVRRVSNSRQTPNLLSGIPDDPVLVDLAFSASSSLPDVSPARPDAALRLALVSPGSPVPHVPADVQIVDFSDKPDLIWDRDRREVITVPGDIVAYGVADTEIGTVIATWKAVKQIGNITIRDSLSIRVDPHDGYHRDGDLINVSIGGMTGSYFTLIGLSGNGTVHYLYPLPEDGPAIPTTKPFELPLKITPPFGIDHIVAVTSRTQRDGLNMALAGLDGTRSARKVAQLLAGAASTSDGWQFGIQGLFTKPSDQTRGVSRQSPNIAPLDR